MSVDSPVSVERFARVFVKGPEELPSNADTYYSEERGYYFKLHLEDVTTEEASPLISKAQERFDVELVRRVTQDGIYKERVYIDDPSEAPDDKKVHEGPAGGLYYETGVEEVGIESDADARNVAVIHWDDVEIGDDIVYETPSGEEVFAEVIEIEEHSDEADTVVVEIDGEAERAMPGTYTVSEEAEKAEGSVTSATAGVHSARYSEEDEDEEDADTALPPRAETEKLFEKEDGQWVSFVGPQGGEGWVNLQTGEKRYQKQRPGDGPEGSDEGEFASGWTEPPEDLSDLEWGQQVEFYNENKDEFIVGEYVGENDHGYPAVETSDGAVMPIAEDLANTPTAIEEDYDPHSEWFDDPDNDYDEEAYWAAIEDDIPPDAYDDFRQFDVGEEVQLDLPGIDGEVEVPIYGYVDGENDNFGASKESLVFHYDDIADAVGMENMIASWDEPGESSPTITGPPHSVGTVVQSLGDEEEAEGSDEEHSWDEADLGEEEWLEQQGVEIGTSFNYDGMDVTVDGATSMTGDELSHIVVEAEGGNTVPLHPNSVPETIDEGPLEGTVETANDPGFESDDYDSVIDEGVGIYDLAAGTDVIVTDGSYYTTAEVGSGNTSFIAGNETIYPNQVEVAAVHEDHLSAVEEGGAEDEGTAPSEEETAEAVAEPPDEEVEDGYDLEEYDPDDVEEFRDMSDIGANHGNSVAAMEVAVMPDGSKAVHKDVSHHSVSADDIKRETAGYEAVKHLDGNVPVHEADVSEGWAMSEVVPGVDAKDATPEMKEAVDEEDFIDMAAKQVIIGNSDLHQNNVRVDENGELYPFDLDRAAGDITGDWVGNLGQYEDTIDRVLGEIESAGSALGVQTGTIFREKVIARAEEVANSLDEETVDQIYEDVESIDMNFAGTIVDNIASLQNGDVEP